MKIQQAKYLHCSAACRSLLICPHRRHLILGCSGDDVICGAAGNSPQHMHNGAMGDSPSCYMGANRPQRDRWERWYLEEDTEMSAAALLDCGLPGGPPAGMHRRTHNPSSKKKL
jgi:hypothetical protein